MQFGFRDLPKWVKAKIDEWSGSVEFDDGAEEDDDLVIMNPLPVEMVEKFKKMKTIGEYFEADFGLLSRGEFIANGGAFGILTNHYYQDPKSKKKIIFTLKKIKLDAYNEVTKADLPREISIQLGIRDADHNTVLHHSFWNNKFLYMVMPYGGKDLGSDDIFFEETKSFTKCMVEVLKGLHYLHTNDILHRDIKLSNILYCVVQDKYRLCDYGNAVKCQGQKRLSRGGGTVAYYSLERKSEGYDGYSFPSDIYALGSCLKEIYKGDDFMILNSLNKMKQSDENSRGTTTEWLKKFAPDYTPPSLKHLDIDLPDFPFSNAEIKRSETLKKIYEPNTWGSNGIPVGIDRAVGLIQFYESIGEVNRSTNTKPRKLSRLFHTGSKQKKLESVNFVDLINLESEDETIIINSKKRKYQTKGEDDGVITKKQTVEKTETRGTHPKESQLSPVDIEELRNIVTIIFSSRKDGDKLTSSQLIEIIQKQYPSSYPNLNANILGKSVLVPMSDENSPTLMKHNRSKYSLIVNLK